MAVDIRRSLKKFVPHLLGAGDQNLNEADVLANLPEGAEPAKQRRARTLT